MQPFGALSYRGIMKIKFLLLSLLLFGCKGGGGVSSSGAPVDERDHMGAPIEVIKNFYGQYLRLGGKNFFMAFNGNTEDLSVDVLLQNLNDHTISSLYEYQIAAQNYKFLPLAQYASDFEVCKNASDCLEKHMFSTGAFLDLNPMHMG